MEHFSTIKSSNQRGLLVLKFQLKMFYRYYELRERDVIKFGFSTREYVLLHEKSDTQEVHESSSSEEEVSDSD